MTYSKLYWVGYGYAKNVKLLRWRLFIERFLRTSEQIIIITWDFTEKATGHTRKIEYYDVLNDSKLKINDPNRILNDSNSPINALNKHLNDFSQTPPTALQQPNPSNIKKDTQN